MRDEHQQLLQAEYAITQAREDRARSDTTEGRIGKSPVLDVDYRPTLAENRRQLGELDKKTAQVRDRLRDKRQIASSASVLLRSHFAAGDLNQCVPAIRTQDGEERQPGRVLGYHLRCLDNVR